MKYDYIGESDLDVDNSFYDGENAADYDMFVHTTEVLILRHTLAINKAYNCLMIRFSICRRHHVVRLTVQINVAMIQSILTTSENCTAR